MPAPGHAIWRAFALAIALLGMHVMATANGETVAFDLPKGDADETLKAFARQAEVSLVYDPKAAQGVRTNEVVGALMPREALDRMLAGTPLKFREDAQTGAYAVTRSAEKSDPTAKTSNKTTQAMNKPTTSQDSKVPSGRKTFFSRVAGAAIAALAGGVPVGAQEAAEEAEDDIFELTPFEVSAEEDTGYRASSTLAGTRMRTNLNDVGSSVSVFTEQLMEDLNAVDNESLLAYGLGTEVGGARGNFINPGTGGLENENLFEPQANNRIRGLTSADSTRNFFKSDVPWDGFNTNRVDVQRGPNSILFGLGSPAGIINNTTTQAGFVNEGELQLRYDQFGSLRASLDYNQVLLEDELALRLSLLRDSKEFRQQPAFSDDERIYASVTYQPKFLNTESITTRFSANFEHGDIESNRPRFVIPLDFVSSFFETGNGFEGEDFATGARFGPQIPPFEGNVGQTRNQLEDADFIQSNPFVNTELRRPSFIRGIVDSRDPNSGMTFREKGLFGRGAYIIREDAEGNPAPVLNEGFVDPATGEFEPAIVVDSIFQPVIGVEMRGKARVANDNGVAFPGFWQDPSFSSPDQFDFFNNLIDGNNKLEQQEFDVFEFQVRNTFLNDRIGYQLSYFSQDMDLRQDAAMGVEFAPTINVDVGELDSFTTDVNNPVVNQFSGRPFIEFNGIQRNRPAGQEEVRDRDARQAQVFATFDPRDFMEEGLATRLIGKHDFTGIIRNRRFTQITRQFLSAGWEPAFIRARHSNRVPNERRPDPGPGARFAELTAAFGVPNTTVRVFLDAEGPNLTQIQPFSAPRFPDDPVSVRGFDTTPLPDFTAEDALAEWLAPDPTAEGGVTELFQANNPANYRGVTELGQFNIVKATDSREALEFLTLRREARTEDIDSEALVWTGSFLDGAVFGMYGWREDDAQQTSLLHNFTLESLAEETEGRTSGPVFDLDSPFRRVSEGSFQSRNWSVKADVTKLFFDNTGFDNSWLPVNISLLFNEGEVQNPQPGRVNFFLEDLPSATGRTIDRSVVISSKNNRYNLRITKFDTVSSNAASGATAPSQVWRLRQTLGWGPEVGVAFIENRDLDWNEDLTPEDLDPLRRQQFEESGFDTVLEYGDFIAQEFRDFSAELFARFPAMNNLKVDPEWDPATTQERDNLILPLDSVFVEDNSSFGLEFDFTAQPTDNWNLTVNAAKVQALRSRIFSDQLNEVLDFFIEGMAGPAGSLPLWGPNGQQVRDRVAPLTGALASNRALLGTPTGELRKWRVNVINDYKFTEGLLDGFGVGGAFRHESSQTIGFQPILIDPATGNEVEPGFPGAAVSVDPDRPFEDQARQTVDVWFKYRRKLTDRIDWRVELGRKLSLAERPRGWSWTGSSTARRPLQSKPDASALHRGGGDLPAAGRER